ncbi:MAG: hypothetical protein ABI729_11010 [Chitinophagales bacterium]
MFLSFVSYSQTNNVDIARHKPAGNSMVQAQPFPEATAKVDIKIDKSKKWKFDSNKRITGALLLTAGLAKGFNEGLQYKYNGFEEIFPKANDQWFYPTFSYNNKFKDNDPTKGPKFPLSTSALVMFTDQYHLNNFIHRAALTAALIIKIGDGKRPLKHYVYDVLYYTACYQVGFQAIHAPIAARN